MLRKQRNSNELKIQKAIKRGSPPTPPPAALNLTEAAKERRVCHCGGEKKPAQF